MNTYFNPAARRWRSMPPAHDPLPFHEGLPGYAPSPLVELPDLAGGLGVARVFLKDESARMGLPAFKILGASYAIARALSRRAGEAGLLPLDALRHHIAPGSVRLVAATDGNHGRAVAHVASLLGLESTIYVPATVSSEAMTAIRGEGADLVELEGSYDDVVAAAAARMDDDTLLIQDTAWPGYTEIPAWIVEGYTTMVREVDAQLHALGLTPDLVAVPVGVGALAQAVVNHYRSTDQAPSVVAVEARNAPSLTAALRGGEPVSVDTHETIMTGLNCGTVSASAWPVLNAGVDTAIAVTDREAMAAVDTLADLGVDSGPCGAATLAGVRRVPALPSDAVVVLLSTEGRAANPKTL